MENMLNFSPNVTSEWAGCREPISLSGQGGAFFLDIPFYRTHCPSARPGVGVLSVIASQRLLPSEYTDLANARLLLT
jgi:hypothetical protein